MTAFQEAFVIFDAIDVPGLTAQMNTWGSNLETTVSAMRNTISEMGAQTESAVFLFQSTVLAQGAEMEAMRNGFVRLEQRQEQVEQF